MPATREQVEELLPIVLRYADRQAGLPFTDPHSAVLDGLAHAAVRYDPALGYTFKTFAWHYIGGRMLQDRRSATCTNRKRQEQIRAGSPRQVWEHLPVSLDELCPLAGELQVELLPDTRPSPEQAVCGTDTETAERISRCLEDLPAEWRVVLRMRYWDGLNQREISERLGLTQMGVSHRERKALARLRLMLEGVG